VEDVWFCLLVASLATYVVLDGFDLGAGIIHLLVARTEEERRTVLRSIGPLWDGNEVWLLAAGGTVFLAFPAVYAAALSGFYLPVMILLWLLILRAISIEFRNHLSHPVWVPFWDALFPLSSLLIALFLGVALGNLVRGVPLDERGRFFEPLWTDFKPGSGSGILDGYSILVGVAAVASLALHGALWVALKTEGRVQERSRRLARRAWWAVAALTVLITYFSFTVQPQLARSLAARPWACVFPATAIAGLAAGRWFLGRGSDGRAFLSSCAYVLGMLASAFAGLYPCLLPASTVFARSLTVENSRAADYGLRGGLAWWLAGMALATGYTVFSYRRFSGKLRPGGEEDGGYG
jgi:cytochrome d ubiquinol oxidase subunit II